ncbi:MULTISPECIES: alkene reductase [Subtercola]|uniref:Alkene reductase n=1 Tax=Subtercola vilae TaxID=2056433 RepID=A0A4T2C6I4_9MICO|nr:MULTISPECIES: alkene reductase [Subtercola]MEA9984393.1 alkene reductase [Subtercola sp. RTI3]TIH40045.1 alkene reductase [Subtercola vilae]
MTDLFSPFTAGDLTLSNRIVMAPLTRTRSGIEGVPGDMVVEQYAQRASVGLIVSEGIYPSFAGQGYPGQPGLVTEEQLAGWQRVTDQVHAEGGTIVAQIMHAGRVSHSEINGNNHVEAPSAIAIDGETHTPLGKAAYPVPHALGEDELPSIVETFVQASKNAVAAGFDGVELHSANGYLLHQFLGATSNVRTDGYGGSALNRTRLVTEVMTAVAEAIGAGRVGIRISPSHNIQGIIENDADDRAVVYGRLMQTAADLGLAFVSVLNAEPSGDFVQGLRAQFGGAFLVNSGFGAVTTRDEAIALIADAQADAVVVGRPVIANPDLVRRWRDDLELNPLDPATLYGAGPEGYTDYPTYDEAFAPVA